MDEDDDDEEELTEQREQREDDARAGLLGTLSDVLTHLLPDAFLHAVLGVAFVARTTGGTEVVFSTSTIT